MKKAFFILAAALLVLGCEKDNRPTGNTEPEGIAVTLSATIGASGSRVAIQSDDDETFNHLWEEDDQIRVFDGSGHGADFDLDGYDALNPSNTAEFSGTFAYAVSGAVYPAANPSAAFDGSNFTVTFPATQAYVAGTYDPAANVYVATCDGTTLSFKSLQCYVRVALWSETASTAVDHIVVSSVDGEKIAGLATVSASGNITMDPSASSSITLSCASPVTLSDNSAAPTWFYIAVPAVSTTGLKVDVYKSDGSHLWRNVSRNPLEKKNKVLKMGTLEYSPVSSRANLKAGVAFNKAIKECSGTDASGGADVDGPNIVKIVFEVNKNMSGITGTDVSNDGDGSVIATFSGGVVRVQSAAPELQMQSASNSMLRTMSNLEAIEGLGFLRYAQPSGGSWKYMFMDNPKLVTVDMSDLNVANSNYATTSSYMFQGCTALETVRFPIANKHLLVNNGDFMFCNCSSLRTLSNLYSGDNSFSTADSMFFNCSSLETLDLSHLKTHNVKSAKRMFLNCSSLETITTNANFTFAVCTTMISMFNGCSSLTSVDVSRFNTEKVKSMASMFRECHSLTNLDLSGFNTASDTSMANMFFRCLNLETLDISSFDLSAISGASGLEAVFGKCRDLQELTLGEKFLQTYTPTNFFMGNSYGEEQTASGSATGELHINCWADTGEWLTKTNLRFGNKSNPSWYSSATSEILFYIWDPSSSSYVYKTAKSNRGGAEATIYWPSTASADPSWDYDWTVTP